MEDVNENLEIGHLGVIGRFLTEDALERKWEARERAGDSGYEHLVVGGATGIDKFADSKVGMDGFGEVDHVARVELGRKDGAEVRIFKAIAIEFSGSEVGEVVACSSLGGEVTEVRFDDIGGGSGTVKAVLATWFWCCEEGQELVVVLAKH